LVTFGVTLNETGLGAGVGWFLNITSQPSVYTTTGSAGTQLPNGTYTYAVATGDSQYEPNPRTGMLTVAGAPLSETVTFSLLTSPVTFSEAGLPSGTSWSVTFDGALRSATSPSSISFTTPNGTYTYAVTPVSAYTVDKSTGQVTVAGVPQTVTLTFSPVPPATFQLQFTETGLPAGTNWSVTIGVTTHYSDGGATVTFTEPNGTYSYTIGSVEGFTAAPTASSVSLTGANQSVPVTFTGTGPTPTPSNASSPGLSTLEWAIIGIVVVAVVIAAAVVLMRRRTPPAPPPSPDLP
jgi:hypothetical protein